MSGCLTRAMITAAPLAFLLSSLVDAFKRMTDVLWMDDLAFTLDSDVAPYTRLDVYAPRSTYPT